MPTIANQAQLYAVAMTENRLFHASGLLSTDPVTAEMAKATAVLVALASSASVATAIERAIIPEAIVGAVDSLPGRSRPASAGHDGVMETLIRLITGVTERDLRMVRRCFRCAHRR